MKPKSKDKMINGYRRKRYLKARTKKWLKKNGMTWVGVQKECPSC